MEAMPLTKPFVVWIVEIRCRMERPHGGHYWTSWGPVEHSCEPGKPMPDAFYTKRLAEWERKDLIKSLKKFPRMLVYEHRVAKYVRSK